MSEKTYRANEVVSCVDEGEDGAMLYNPDKDETVLLNPSGRIRVDEQGPAAGAHFLYCRRVRYRYVR